MIKIQISSIFLKFRVPVSCTKALSISYLVHLPNALVKKTSVNILSFCHSIWILILLTDILPYKIYSLFLSSRVGPQEFRVPLPYTVTICPGLASRSWGREKRCKKIKHFMFITNVKRNREKVTVIRYYKQPSWLIHVFIFLK